MKSFNQENHGSDSFFIANLLLGIAFSLQKHCYFYCSFIGKVLIINMIITMKGEGRESARERRAKGRERERARERRAKVRSNGGIMINYQLSIIYIHSETRLVLPYFHANN